MATSLLLRLDGPLQSWGVSSRYTRRETLDHPSKSGVVGLCAAALGRRRGDSVEDLARLRFGVLVVDPGRIVEDYQTVAHAIRASRARRVDVTPEAVIRYWTGREIARQELPSAGDNDGGVKATEITRRTYLADAMFVAALEGDRELLESVRLRLRDPVFPLSLGRAACLPAAPVAMGEREDGGLVPLDAEGALRSLIPEAHEWCSLRHPARAERERRAQGMRIIIECDPAEATIRVQDQPSAYAFSTRTFGTRYSRAVGIGATDA